MGGANAVARRTFADARVRTGSFVLLFALVAYANPAGYRHSYPTRQDRLGFAHSFGTNKAIELFYGVPHDLLTVGGYAAWRTSGIASIFAAVWGMIAAIRALRTEEDSGRAELVLAGTVGRRAAYLAVLVAIALGAAFLWIAAVLGLVGAHLPLAGSAYLALAIVSPIPVFAGVGALASQVAGTRRLALELATVVLALAFLLRVVADTSSGLGWLRWATPLGWAEELRPFTGAQPMVLALPALLGASLLVASGLIAARRDTGRGLLHSRDFEPPSLRLLSSPTAFALRSERGALAAWGLGTCVFALIVGILSTSFTNENIPGDLQRQLHKLGGASITTPAGALGFYFLFFVLTISLFACAQLAAARREESEQQLETLFALSVPRRRWLAGRMLLASAGAVGLAAVASLLAWVGAASQHAGVSLPRLLEAGANCLPTALLFLALAALAFAVVPRAATGVSYGLVAATFLWQLLGAVLGAPRWLLDVSPFQHVALVPAQAFRAPAAAAMLALAAVATLASFWTFRHRDLTGS